MYDAACARDAVLRISLIGSIVAKRLFHANADALGYPASSLEKLRTATSSARPRQGSLLRSNLRVRMPLLRSMLDDLKTLRRYWVEIPRQGDAAMGCLQSPDYTPVVLASVCRPTPPGWAVVPSPGLHMRCGQSVSGLPKATSGRWRRMSPADRS